MEASCPNGHTMVVSGKDTRRKTPRGWPHAGTMAHKVLLALHSLGGIGRYEDIVIRVWQMDKESFGLPGHDHPDSKKVQSLLSGCLTRFVWRSAPCTYELTGTGRRYLEVMRDAEGRTATQER